MSLTIDFLPLPVFLDLLPFSSHVALHKLVNASFGYAVSFLERLCTLTITEAFSTQSKDSLFNLTKINHLQLISIFTLQNSNNGGSKAHFNSATNCIPGKKDARFVEKHGYRDRPFPSIVRFKENVNILIIGTVVQNMLHVKCYNCKLEIRGNVHNIKWAFVCTSF